MRLDMLARREWPELGGCDKYLDVIGVNFYPHNQWTLSDNRTLERSDARYRPFVEILSEVDKRYERPILVSETGAVGEARVEWLTYIVDQVRAAVDSGIPVEGICLYPLINCPGWEDGQICEHGLWGDADMDGRRPAYPPLVEELERQISLMNQMQGQLYHKD